MGNTIDGKHQSLYQKDEILNQEGNVLMKILLNTKNT